MRLAPHSVDKDLVTMATDLLITGKDPIIKRLYKSVIRERLHSKETKICISVRKDLITMATDSVTMRQDLFITKEDGT